MEEEIKLSQIRYTSSVMAKLSAQLDALEGRSLTEAEANKKDVLVRLAANQAAMLKDIGGS